MPQCVGVRIKTLCLVRVVDSDIRLRYCRSCVAVVDRISSTDVLIGERLLLPDANLSKSDVGVRISDLNRIHFARLFMPPGDHVRVDDGPRGRGVLCHLNNRERRRSGVRDLHERSLKTRNAASNEACGKWTIHHAGIVGNTSNVSRLYRDKFVTRPRRRARAARRPAS
ncbi:hypothetical protein Bxe_A0091 [Paraburkholderia xenovorans LB400]|uniref:Uncharacterized protein n=1 Tax=Paraburkholderia xenovorans (strain LB400) TaxID=266265 RepID=Q13SU9_PARXL|nr:hypothetical protein Bxe_A0091 [Paraburkholderia xenovorans LB400]